MNSSQEIHRTQQQQIIQRENLRLSRENLAKASHLINNAISKLSQIPITQISNVSLFSFAFLLIFGGAFLLLLKQYLKRKLMHEKNRLALERRNLLQQQHQQQHQQHQQQQLNINEETWQQNQ
eukprot:TRINITY_DN650_c2_g2_i2.p1 TRINITY_DN650_c2_g2~~TRINITY_DN650_c2_g2_i2.p1  ORF type:complete len:123 (-),score=55.93 TRINITY_DN650_c2_g2_i2:316-684(-)